MLLFANNYIIKNVIKNGLFIEDGSEKSPFLRTKTEKCYDL